MDIESYRTYCMAKKGVTEDFPFDENVLVFRVGNKIFALCDVSQFASVNLKCDPEKAIELREKYNGVRPGYHMSKVHWNTIETNDDVPTKVIFELIDHSYELIMGSLPKSRQREILESGS